MTTIISSPRKVCDREPSAAASLFHGRGLRIDRIIDNGVLPPDGPFPAAAATASQGVRTGLALRAREMGAWREALDLVDPLCGDHGEAALLLLRADLLGKLGHPALADDDVVTAAERQPGLPGLAIRLLDRRWQWRAAANRRWHERHQAALASVRAAMLLDPGAHLDAFAHLGTDCVVACRAKPDGLLIVTWASSDRPVALSIRSARDRQDVTLRPCRSTSVTGALPWRAELNLPWPPDWDGVTISVASDIVVAPARALARPLHCAGTARPAHVPADSVEAGHVTVIVPVHGDPDTAEACLTSVLADRPRDLSRRLLIVDDASTDDRIGAMLDALARLPDVNVIRTTVNAGYIGAINRGLAAAPPGDVVLLNADTVVPHGWIDRLARHRGPGIGTITPLSNNGELASFPVPDQAHAVPDANMLIRLDRAAASLGSAPVELPNGLGFCLYLTQACREAIGTLNDLDFRDGYLEEVDLCARASRAGFRHLCATDVFVAHHGGKSFGTRKRALVLHNLHRLRLLHPHVEADTQAFRRSDPLRPTRTALQRALLRDGARQRTLVPAILGLGLERWFGRDTGMFAPDEPLLIDTARPAQDRSLVLAHLEGAAAPCRLDLPLDPSDEGACLADWLASFGLSSVTVLDPDPRTLDLARALGRGGVDLIVRLLDDSWLGEPGASSHQRRLFLSEARVETVSPALAGRFAAAYGRLPKRLGAASPRSSPGDGQLQRGAPADHARAGFAVLALSDRPEHWRAILELGRLIQTYSLQARLIMLGIGDDEPLLERTGAVGILPMPDAGSLRQACAARGLARSIVLADPASVEHPLQGLLAHLPRPILTNAPDLLEANGLTEAEMHVVAAEAGAMLAAVIRACVA